MVIAEIDRHPVFELVGAGVSNPDKVGRDAGEICGVPAVNDLPPGWVTALDLPLVPGVGTIR